MTNELKISNRRNQNKMESKSFESLEIYKRACILRKKIFELTKKFPLEEKYKLVDQIIRSTRKCPANIAEGHGRYHFQENIQFCRIARGSLTESPDHLNCAFECGYIDANTLKNMKEETGEWILGQSLQQKMISAGGEAIVLKENFGELEVAVRVQAFDSALFTEKG